MATGSGTIAGWTIDTDSIYVGTKDTSGFTSGNGHMTISSTGAIHGPKFYMDSSGNMAMEGTVTATAGAIGGFTIANNDITGSGGKWVTSNVVLDDFNIGGGQDYNVTKRVELLPSNILIRTYIGHPLATDGIDASRIIFNAAATASFSYSDGETIQRINTAKLRTENIEFGKYNTSDVFSSKSLFIGVGGGSVASIRNNINDASSAYSIMKPDSTNAAWIVGQKMEVRSVVASTTAMTNSSYRFSVVGTSYLSDDVRLGTALGVGVAANATNGTIYASNNIVAYSSDKRLKENVKTIKNPLEKVLGLEGVIFNWNELAEKEAGFDRKESQAGLFAQDLQKVLPEAVKIAPFDSDPSGSSISGEKYLTIQYERVVPLLVESIKEMSLLVSSLEDRIKKIEGNK
jgi:hypothetical protein